MVFSQKYASTHVRARKVPLQNYYIMRYCLIFLYLQKKMRRLSIILLLFVFPAICNAAESGLPIGYRNVEYFSDTDGYIAESQIWGIECSMEEVFFATNDGLFSFDGARIRRHYAKQVISLRDLKFDPSSDRLYSAGNNGFGWWEKDTMGQMIYHSVESDDYSFLSQDFWKVCLFRNGNIAFESLSRICVLNPESGNISEILPRTQFKYMYEVGGDVFVQDGNILCRINVDAALEDICQTEDRIMDIVQCGGKTIAALERTGLMEFSGDRLIPLNAESSRILSAAKILSLARYDDGHVLVGTTQGGYFITDLNGAICNEFQKTLNSVNASVLSIERDRNGDVWLGMEAGVAKIDNSSKNYFLQDPRLGRVRGIASLAGGRLLTGSNKGAFIFDGSIFLPVKGTTGSVWNVFKFDGVPYIAHDQGLIMMDGDNAVLLYNGSGVMSMERSKRDSSIFVCGTYNGLALFSEAGGRPRFVCHIDNYNGFCRNIHFDAQDRLWIRDGQKGFIRLTFSPDYRSVIDRKDFDIVHNQEKHYVFSICTEGKQLYCCNKETYVVDDAGELVRSAEGDSLLGNFEYSYGTISSYRNATEPFLLQDGVYAFGMLNGLRISYGHREIEESLTISQVELLGSRKREFINLREDIHRVPFDMNTIQIYAAGNFNGNYIEYCSDQAPGQWTRARISEPVQISSLPFGNHEVVMRLPENPSASCRIKFHICRPWYLSGWALLAYIAALFVIISGIRGYYKRQTREARERAKLKAELKSKSKELANITFNSVKRNNQLNEIKNMLTSGDAARKPSEIARVSRETVRLIDSYLEDESDWEKSEEYFNIIYDGLLEKLKSKYPGISKTDMKLCVYTKLNLSTKEIADLMSISIRSVEMGRYRLRKRLGLPTGENIRDFVKNL